MIVPSISSITIQRPRGTGKPAHTTPGHGAFIETAHVPFESATSGAWRPYFAGDLFAFKTASFVAITDLRLNGHERTVNPYTEYKLVSEKWVGDDYVIDTESDTTTAEDGYVPPDPEDGAVVDHSPHVTHAKVHVVCSTVLLTCTTTYRTTE